MHKLFSRYVQLTYGGVTKSGVLLVDMNFSGIEQVCQNVELANGGYIYLIDGNGEIIYHPKQQLIYAGLQEENNIQASTYADGTYKENFLGDSRLVSVKTVGYTGWKLIEQERQKRRSELEILQSQINPHFLYNTLDSIIWMTEAGRYEESIQMVTSLARFFRISLSRGKRIIPLKDELEHAKHYMTIQQIRFKNKFTTEITAQPDTENIYTLKLIIQPILENAIYHGMAACEEDGLIRVNAWRDNDDLIIDVSDNGIGMRPEIANSLLDENRPDIKTSGSGMGVRNVHRRIQLNFGEQYGLSIFSEPDEGTCVRIRLPALNDELAKQMEENE